MLMRKTSIIPRSKSGLPSSAFRRAIRCAAFLALLAIFVGGCVRSVQPILKDEQVTTDDSLTGHWADSEGKDSVEVTRSAVDSNYNILYTDKDGKTAQLVGRIGKFGGLLIAEFHPVDPASKASDIYRAHLLPLYSFLIVQKTTPQLVFTTLAPDWMKKYVADHPTEIASFQPDKDSIVVTASTDDFQKFILAHQMDPGAMSDQTTFVRPGDPTTLKSDPGQ